MTEQQVAPGHEDRLAVLRDPARHDPDAVLAALDPEQREVATSLSGPVCVLAGAGTGKTRAITHRIAYGAHAGLFTPQQVLAVTFTARAAGEMRTRLRDLGVPGVQARTFHAAALRQLQFFWPQVVGGAAPRLIDHKAPLIADAASRLRLRVDRTSIRDLSAEVEWSKVSLLTAEDYAARAVRAGRGTPGGFDLPTIARLIDVYEQAKTERNVIDFEDVLLLTAGILEERGDVATTVRGQYRHFVVDEYQDVSPLQQRLLDLWLGGRDDLCVVGDASQTIYSFTGASPRFLLDFATRYEGATVVKLVRDYRSTPQVVRLANGLLDRAKGQHAQARLELKAQRPPGPEPTFTGHGDDVAESAAVARRIKGLVDGGHPVAEIAVLFRTNAQSEALEHALAEKGIPYVLRGGERFFARKEVRDAIVLLRGAARSSGDEELTSQVRSVLATSGWTQTSPSATGAVRERWESLQALVMLADELAQRRPGSTMADLVEELAERAAAQHAPQVQGVTLGSLHAAKGLEWDVVFLVGASEGLLPISFASDDESVEEERRLMYVGVTRAREQIHISWSRSRTPGGRASRNPSRFLDGLRPATPEDERPTPTAKTRGGRSAKRAAPALCRTCGGALSTGAERKVGRCSACPATYDEALLEALKAWRTEVATAAKVPAYVVFTDATLVAMAETLPKDLPGLSAISGVGTVKLTTYGQAVLDVLAPFR